MGEAQAEHLSDTASWKTLAQALDAFADVALDIDAVLEVIARRTAEVVGDVALVTLVSDDGAWLRPAAVYSADPAVTREYRAMLESAPGRAGDGRAGQVIATNTPLLIANVEPAALIASTRPEWREVATRLNVHSLMIVPMRVRGVPIGSFSLVRSRPGVPYGPREQALLQGVADRGALAVANARAHAVLKERLALSEREAERRDILRGLFDSMPQLGWTARPDGFIDYYNRGWYDYTGTTPEQMEGWGWQSVHDPDLLPEIMERWKATLESEAPFEMDIRLRRHDGEYRTFLTRVNPQRDAEGKLVRWVGVNTDIEDQKRLEASIAHARDEKIQRLAAEKAALEEKARLQEFQERFLAILGHDLRNPLAAIDMGAAVLRERAAKNKDTSGARMLERMAASSRRMGRMIEQILDLTRSRLAGGLEMNPAPMDLVDTLARVVDELKLAHPARALDLQSPPLRGRWDRDRLEQVFSNLVGNAVHYGVPEKPVSIRGGEEEGAVWIEVHNDGTPIPDELMTSLFSPFRRGDRESRRALTAGLGLGLYISQQIALAHGGGITVTSTASAGTTFRVTLPRPSARLVNVPPVE